MLKVRRPSADELASLAEDLRSDPLTYDDVGATVSGDLPDGYHHARAQVVVGHGRDAFERGKKAVQDWVPQRGAGLVVSTGAEVVENAVVAIAASLGVGWVIVVCRVVEVVDEPNRFGFAYGTLAVHPESGEELFVVEQADDGTVTFRIAAFSRQVHPLARLAPPVARFMQERATRRYLEAMRAAVQT